MLQTLNQNASFFVKPKDKSMIWLEKLNLKEKVQLYMEIFLKKTENISLKVK